MCGDVLEPSSILALSDALPATNLESSAPRMALGPETMAEPEKSRVRYV